LFASKSAVSYSKIGKTVVAGAAQNTLNEPGAHPFTRATRYQTLGLTLF
jgi:hypothetical protein